MSAPEAEERQGLTGLDWVVIVAATVSLVIVVTWLVQGRNPSPTPPTE